MPIEIKPFETFLYTYLGKNGSGCLECLGGERFKATCYLRPANHSAQKDFQKTSTTIMQCDIRIKLGQLFRHLGESDLASRRSHWRSECDSASLFEAAMNFSLRLVSAAIRGRRKSLHSFNGNCVGLSFVCRPHTLHSLLLLNQSRAPWSDVTTADELCVAIPVPRDLHLSSPGLLIHPHLTVSPTHPQLSRRYLLASLHLGLSRTDTWQFGFALKKNILDINKRHVITIVAGDNHHN